jgi:serine/threonine protein kinase
MLSPKLSSCWPLQNVLLSTSGTVAKLSDVGLARMVNEGRDMPRGGTQLYAAPEQLLDLQCGPSADIFAFGWLLQEVVTGKALQRRGVREVLR